MMGFDPSFPKQLRADCTFYAPLTSSLVAYGRGDVTPTYTRNSIATYLNPTTGLITQVAANVPRFEANGYLSEGARTNALKDSAGFVNGWAAPQFLRTTPANSPPIVAPDGTSATYYIMAEDGSNAQHLLFQSYTSTTKTNQVLSIYAKPGGRTFLAVYLDDGGAGYVIRYFNLSTCAVASSAKSGSASDWYESSSSATLAPNGYCRCVMVSGTATGTAKRARFQLAQSDGVIQWTGDNSSSLFIFGAQVEDNATFASSYIPTTTGAVQRVADVLTYPSAGNITPSSPTTESITYTPSSIVAGDMYCYDTLSADSKNGTIFYVNNGRGFINTYADAVQSAQVTAVGAFTAGNDYRMDLTYETDRVEPFLNGTSLGLDTSATLPGIRTRIGIGQYRNGASGLQPWARLRRVNVFSSRLTPWELGMIH